jgi:hypothetical protein
MDAGAARWIRDHRAHGAVPTATLIATHVVEDPPQPRLGGHPQRSLGRRTAEGSASSAGCRSDLALARFGAGAPGLVGARPEQARVEEHGASTRPGVSSHRRRIASAAQSTAGLCARTAAGRELGRRPVTRGSHGPPDGDPPGATT